MSHPDHDPRWGWLIHDARHAERELLENMMKDDTRPWLPGSPMYVRKLPSAGCLALGVVGGGLGGLAVFAGVCLSLALLCFALGLFR